MKVILDTNVVVSGIFFGGIPRKIIDCIPRKVFTTVLSNEIIDEYSEVVERVAKQYHISNGSRILDSIIGSSELTLSIALKEQICEDPDDDKFLSAALAAKAKVIVSGDKHLKAVSGWAGISVITPQAFFKILEIQK